MKKFAKIFMAAMMVAIVGFVACSKDDDKKADSTPTPDPNPEQYTESTIFTIKYDGVAVAAGDTVIYTHTTGMSVVLFDIVNKTLEPQNACFKVEMVEGPDIMKEIGFCFGVCDNYTCPFIAPRNGTYDVAAGGESAFDMQFLNGAAAGTTALYRLTAGRGRSLEDPQVIFVGVTL